MNNAIIDCSRLNPADAEKLARARQAERLAEPAQGQSAQRWAGAGADGAPQHAPVADFDDEGVRRQADAAWHAQAALRAEFPDKAGYVALRVAESQGRVRVVRSTVIRGERNTSGDHRGNV